MDFTGLTAVYKVPWSELEAFPPPPPPSLAILSRDILISYGQVKAKVLLCAMWFSFVFTFPIVVLFQQQFFNFVVRSKCSTCLNLTSRNVIRTNWTGWMKSKKMLLPFTQEVSGKLMIM